MSLKISSHFDAGAIEIVKALGTQDIQLNLRKDTHADFSQWFYFRLQGARGQACTLRILNAGEATYPDGWVDYRAVASYDRENWLRVPTDYDGQVLTIRHTPERDSVYYAYFEPYSSERHLRLLGSAETCPHIRIEDIGSTVEGRDMNMLVAGTPAPEKRKIWVIARQHPGETMAEWLIEGMVHALMDSGNPFASRLLQHAVIYIVPNMNPDGAAHGNLRTNAAGANLNREWMDPSPERSPEVYEVRRRIHETGCDVFLDIHGDEALPYVFVAGCEMLQGFTDRQAAEQQAFVASLQQASPDFQTQFGYPSGKYNADLLKLASKYIGHTFGCVSLTLEMPFKDNALLPDVRSGWNGARSAALGRAMLQPLLNTLDI